MKFMNTSKKISRLVESEVQNQQKLNEIVLQSVEEEKLISQKLFDFEDRTPGLAGKLADKVAEFGGSWAFIVSFIAVMLVWIGSNVYFLQRPFDPYPFILLNLVLSSVAALQAPVIMMSQNRKEVKDRQRAINDYMVNLKAEIEVRNLHQKLDLLIAEEMKNMFEIQKLQMEMMEDIRKQLILHNARPAKTSSL
jgi:uncharacterized membrane protein